MGHGAALPERVAHTATHCGSCGWCPARPSMDADGPSPNVYNIGTEIINTVTPRAPSYSFGVLHSGTKFISEAHEAIKFGEVRIHAGDHRSCHAGLTPWPSVGRRPRPDPVRTMQKLLARHQRSHSMARTGASPRSLFPTAIPRKTLDCSRQAQRMTAPSLPVAWEEHQPNRLEQESGQDCTNG